MSVHIIAEIGVNHDGDPEKARRLILEAKKSGADSAKLQSFVPDQVVKSASRKARYQMQGEEDLESSLEMLRRLSLSRQDQESLISFGCEHGIEVFSSPFDMDSARFLGECRKIQKIKLGSGEITNYPLIHYLGTTGKSVWMSTGASSMDEVDLALRVFCTGAMGRSADIQPDWCPEMVRNRIVLLHCVSQYPAPAGELNLASIHAMKGRYPCPIGWSDHSPGTDAAVLAIGAGASVIEKHLTLCSKDVGPDHSSSLEPEEFRQLVEKIRKAEKMMGYEMKAIQNCERDTVGLIRRSLYSSRPIQKNEVLKFEHFTCLRPEDGSLPLMLLDLIGSKAPEDLDGGVQIPQIWLEKIR